jgi:hypothetical protein
MKKRERALLKCLQHQQLLTLRAMNLLKQIYSQDSTAENASPAGMIKKLDAHSPIQHTEPAEFLRGFQ